MVVRLQWNVLRVLLNIYWLPNYCRVIPYNFQNINAKNSVLRRVASLCIDTNTIFLFICSGVNYTRIDTKSFKLEYLRQCWKCGQQCVRRGPLLTTETRNKTSPTMRNRGLRMVGFRPIGSQLSTQCQTTQSLCSRYTVLCVTLSPLRRAIVGTLALVCVVKE